MIYDIINRFIKKNFQQRAVCIQQKFINEVMYVNDIGAQRATRSTCRGEQSAQRRASFTSYATRLVAIGWSFCARCRAHVGRDVRVPSANAVSQIRSVGRCS